MTLKHKFLNYANQDGRNVSVPRSFRARPGSDTVNLAYITPQEQGILQTLKPGTPHRGPMEIPNYDSFDAAGGYSNPDTGYSASSGGGGGGGWQDSGRADAKVNEMAEQVRRNYVNKENIRSSPLHDRYNPNWKMGGARGGRGFGALLRGALGFFGGIPGKIMSGIMSARKLAQRGVGKIGEEVDEFSQYPTLDRYLNRNTDKYKDKPYLGQGQSNYTFGGADQGNNLGLFTNTLNQPYVDEGRIGEYWRQPQNNNLGVNNQVIEEEQNLYPNVGLGAAEGGRIGYRYGLFVDENIEGPGYDFNEGMEIASAPDPMDALNDFSLEIFNKPYDQLNDEERGILHDLANEQAMGEQDQGIASLV